MERPVLVLLAAGMGSRYGGLKQMDPMDEAGNLIIDFSIYDALRAGFKDVLFIIKREIEADFHGAIGDRISKFANVSYAFQEMDKLPDGLCAPTGRHKPLGTTHALLCAADEIAGRPFAVANSDDYYGPEAFRLLYDYLTTNQDPAEQLLVGYRIENTLTENGGVARGVCAVNGDGFLTHIAERRKVFKQGECAEYTEDGETFVPLPAGTPVSMNCWGFKSGILNGLRNGFIRDFPAGIAANPEKYEDLLPDAVQKLMSAGETAVRVQSSHDRWFGVTYREDKPGVIENIARMKREGLYTEKLWS